MNSLEVNYSIWELYTRFFTEYFLTFPTGKSLLPSLAKCQMNGREAFEESFIDSLLFILFINDLFLPIEDIFIYADDTSIIIKAENLNGPKLKVSDVLQ